MKTALICGHVSADPSMVWALAVKAGLVPAIGSPPDLTGQTDGIADADAEAWLGAQTAATGTTACLDYRDGLLERWLQAEPDPCLVLVYAPPAWALLARSKPLDAANGAAHDRAALDDWVHCNTRLLKLAAGHPERCVLVNALAAVHAPEVLCAQLAQSLQLDLPPQIDAGSVQRSARPALDATLAKHRVPPLGQAELLYQELESAATLDTEPLALALAEQRAALDELAALRRDSAELGDLRTTSAEQAETLAKLLSTQAGQAEELGRAVADARQECELLQQQLHSTQEELESAFFSRQAEAESHRAALMRLSGEHDKQVQATAQVSAQAKTSLDQANRKFEDVNRKLEEVTRKFEELSRKFEERKAQLKSAAGEKDALEKETQLLVLQLHQVQEELEHHHLSAGRQDSRIAEAQRDLAFLRRLWAANQPDDVLIDLRQPIEGDNWYDAEADGRWTGPSTASTLVFPALGAGDYSVQIDVVDAIRPEVLAGLEVMLNGVSVDCESTAEFPSFVLGNVRLDTAEDLAWTLTLTLPWLHAPSEFGVPDDRLLGIRVRSVAFSRLGR